MQKKKILFVCSKAPYGTSLSREALEAILAGGVFEQDISVLFVDDGVFQLFENQQPESIEVKSHFAMLQALPLYDIENLYIEADSLNARGMDHRSVNSPFWGKTAVLDNAEIKNLFASQDAVLSF